MNRIRHDELSWRPAGDDHFTGEVAFGPISPEPSGDELNVLAVSFAPGARTDWHRHPGGQVLYVVAGEARIQAEGSGRVVAGPGDAVYSPPGEVHWHGAGPDAEMTHLSITAGGPTEWLPRRVTDDEYLG